MSATTAFTLVVATANRDSTLAAMKLLRFPCAMKCLVALLGFWLARAAVFAATPLLTLDNEQLPSPAGVGAQAPQFVAMGDGRLALAWSEPGFDAAPVLRYARLDPQTHAWDKPLVLGPVGASPVSAPVFSGPVTVNNGGRLATVWFVADGKDPRVLLSVSPDAGAHFLMPLRIEDAKPIGNPDAVLLSDGTVFVSWLEHYNKDETAIWLRRVSPGGSLSVPVLLATLPSDRASPRLALLKDYDATPAQLLLAYALGDAAASHIVVRRLTIPLPDLVSTANPCNCPTGDEAVRGYALRGRIVSLDLAHSALVVRHDAIAGVIPAAATEFKTDPTTLKLASAGNEIFARIEQRGDAWWLFDARLIVRP